MSRAIAAARIAALGGRIATEVVTDLIAFTPIGLALYQAVTAGAAIAPLAFPPFPAG